VVKSSANPFFLTPASLTVKSLKTYIGNTIDCEYWIVGVSVCLHWKKRINKRRKNTRTKLESNANFMVRVHPRFNRVMVAAPSTRLICSENASSEALRWGPAPYVKISFSSVKIFFAIADMLNVLNRFGSFRSTRKLSNEFTSE
jgi:hypothetical protein